MEKFHSELTCHYKLERILTLFKMLKHCLKHWIELLWTSQHHLITEKYGTAIAEVWNAESRASWSIFIESMTRVQFFHHLIAWICEFWKTSIWAVFHKNPENGSLGEIV